jgi:hypothetical protein
MLKYSVPMNKYFYSKFPELREGGKINGKNIRLS